MPTHTDLPTPQRYLFDNAWEHAQRRLTLLEQCFDPGTIRWLRRVGIQPGWRCLEAGAGAGSIARWLCSEVGPDGRVLAVDLDTRLLREADKPNLDVLRADLRTYDLPRHSFDLVHARAVLMHIPERQQILDQMVAALRPGGTLLIEDADHFPIAAMGTGLYAEVWDAFINNAARAGLAKDWARQLPSELYRRGLRDIWTDCGVALYEGGSMQSELARLSLSQARDLVVAEGISPQRIDEWDRLLAEPGRWFPGLAMVAACGRAG
jgi:2-polyprenyl-3-methyl-5-hydroxy-6-metoxy-1,4-benzoquinol methylase